MFPKYVWLRREVKGEVYIDHSVLSHLIEIFLLTFSSNHLSFGEILLVFPFSFLLSVSLFKLTIPEEKEKVVFPSLPNQSQKELSLQL